jgi:hypothetical protein
MKTTTVIIKYADCTLQVTGTYTAGRLGTMEDPPEYSEFEVEKVDLIDGDLAVLLSAVAFYSVSWHIKISELALEAYEKQLSDLQEWIEK